MRWVCKMDSLGSNSNHQTLAYSQDYNARHIKPELMFTCEVDVKGWKAGP